jgi:hypothetical protein
VSVGNIGRTDSAVQYTQVGWVVGKTPQRNSECREVVAEVLVNAVGFRMTRNYCFAAAFGFGSNLLRSSWRSAHPNP